MRRSAFGQILWIDDKIGDYAPYIANLAVHRFQLFPTARVSDFLQILRSEAIDIAIVDLKLAQLERGDELIQLLKAHYPLIQIIVYSAYINDFDEADETVSNLRYVKKDPRDVPSSPFKETSLLKAVQEALGRKASTVPRKRTPVLAGAWTDWIFPNWTRLGPIAKFAAARLIPFIAIAYGLVKLSATLGVPIPFLTLIEHNAYYLTSVAVLALCTFFYFIGCPRLLRGSVDFVDFMGKYLSLFENDPAFASAIRESNKRASRPEKELKPYDELASHFELTNKSRWPMRLLTFATFLLFVALFVYGVGSDVATVVRRGAL